MSIYTHIIVNVCMCIYFAPTQTRMCVFIHSRDTQIGDNKQHERILNNTKLAHTHIYTNSSTLSSPESAMAVLYMMET